MYIWSKFNYLKMDTFGKKNMKTGHENFKGRNGKRSSEIVDVLP